MAFFLLSFCGICGDLLSADRDEGKRSGRGLRPHFSHSRPIIRRFAPPSSKGRLDRWRLRRIFEIVAELCMALTVASRPSLPKAPVRLHKATPLKSDV